MNLFDKFHLLFRLKNCTCAICFNRIIDRPTFFSIVKEVMLK